MCVLAYVCTEVFEEYKHPVLLRFNTEREIELDVCVPTVELAFEYQGLHHYKPIHWTSEFAQMKRLDEEKSAACKKVTASYTIIRQTYT